MLSCTKKMSCRRPSTFTWVQRLQCCISRIFHVDWLSFVVFVSHRFEVWILSQNHKLIISSRAHSNDLVWLPSLFVFLEVCSNKNTHFWISDKHGQTQKLSMIIYSEGSCHLTIFQCELPTFFPGIFVYFYLFGTNFPIEAESRYSISAALDITNGILFRLGSVSAYFTMTSPMTWHFHSRIPTATLHREPYPSPIYIR